MTIYLGSDGFVELTRTASEKEFVSVVNADDVNETRSRFSCDFPSGMLITGDRIEFKATDGGNLTFVSPSGWNVNEQQPDGDWFIHVDELGGLRLYHNFSDAINGNRADAIPLLTPDRDIPIVIRAVVSPGRCLAKVTSYTFNTAREAVDTTTLSQEFREQFSQLISGSGNLSCIFSYRKDLCESTGQPTEHAIYLHQLCIRQKLGAKFKAKLYIIRPGSGEGEASDDAVWYEFEALVTNAAIAVEPTQIVRSSIQFVTTGEIQLKVATSLRGYLLQEDQGFILLEQDLDSKLEIDFD